MKITLLDQQVRVYVLIAMCLGLFGHYLAHLGTHWIVDDPVYLPVGTAQTDVDAAWEEVEAERDAQSARITQAWLDYEAKYTRAVEQGEGDSWEYWKNYLYSSSQSASNYLGELMDRALHTTQTGLAWSQDRGVDAVNQAKKAAYVGKIYITFPILKGMLWLSMIGLLLVGVARLLMNLLSLLSFNAYGKAKNFMKKIPILSTWISVFFLLLEFFIAYKIGLTTVAYKLASITDLTKIVYGWCGWDMFTNPWWPSLIFIPLIGGIVWLSMSVKSS